jgi:hypothetical protein
MTRCESERSIEPKRNLRRSAPMAIVVPKGESGDEARQLVAEMKELLAAMAAIDPLGNVQDFLQLEKRHHEIAVRLQELTIAK